MIATLLLAAVNQFTNPLIKNYQKEQEKKALYSLSSSEETKLNNFPHSEVSPPYHAIKNSSFPLILGYYTVDNGVICKIKGQGYGGDMIILAFYNREGVILRSQLLQNEETPGFGKKAEEQSYMAMFEGKGSIENPFITLKKELSPKEFDVVNGATITYRGINEALKQGNSFVLSLAIKKNRP